MPQLYRSVLGSAWWDLDDAIRHFHGADGPTVRAAGVFRVQGAANWLTRATARLARLPSPGDAVRVSLLVRADGEGEEWRREFAGCSLLTWQAGGRGGVLLERLGIVELRIRLRVIAGALQYESVGAAMCVGRWRVSLPRTLGPAISAWERAHDEEGRIDVSVDVIIPAVGRLIGYEGTLTPIEEPA